MRKKLKSFDYCGITFTPLKTLKGKAAKFDEISKRIANTGITPKGWNYNEFYKAAKKVDANNGNYDLFSIYHYGEVTVIPGTNYLFVYR